MTICLTNQHRHVTAVRKIKTNTVKQSIPEIGYCYLDMALFCTHQSLSTVRDSSGHHELDVDDYKTDINVSLPRHM